MTFSRQSEVSILEGGMEGPGAGPAPDVGGTVDPSLSLSHFEVAHWEPGAPQRTLASDIQLRTNTEERGGKGTSFISIVLLLKLTRNRFFLF